jgi:hypothetical protein
MKLALVIAALGLAGCDPFVIQIDEPSVCGIAAHQPFTATATGWQGRVSLDLPVQDVMKSAPHAKARAALGSLSLTSASPSLGSIQGARVQILPTAPESASGVEIAGTRAPSLDCQTLTISGTGADVLPQLENGPVQLVITLDGDSHGQPLVADVGACAALELDDAYLK